MTVNHDVAGSSPARGAKKEDIPFGVSSFFSLCWFIHLHCGDSYVLLPTERGSGGSLESECIQWMIQRGRQGVAVDRCGAYATATSGTARRSMLIMMSLVQAQHGEPWKKDTILLNSVFFQWNKSFGFLKCPTGVKYCYAMWNTPAACDGRIHGKREFSISQF